MKCTLCNNRFCNILDVKTKKLLCDYSTIVTQQKNQTETSFYLENYVEILLEGFCIVQTYSEDGKKLFNFIMIPGDVIGAYSDFESFENSQVCEIVALTNVKKCIIPRKIYNRLFKNNISFSNAIAHNLMDVFSRYTKWTFLHSLTAEKRVEYVYTELKKLGIKDLNSITQKDIAFIAGVSRVTVIRAMKKIFLANDKTEKDFP